ncbi:hypothetical protein B9Z55_003739 [Caenorhabditis nigoni]|uniref:Tyrosine-protein kinase n=1 Tax=Caenorhabditis nigoni TaxID=1611254 RepID=A0A2G5VRW4_9PELO|nr:hypothetical protein B9Z55_003739 [Caenorhabditis nigoni]
MNSNGKENGNDGADEISDKGLSDVISDGATSSGSTATTSSGKEENPEEDYIRNHLKTYTWYHGLMFGNICDKLLKWDYSFLVRRVITKSDKFLCISVRIASKVYHFRLRTNQHGWTCPKLHEKFPRLPKQRYEHIFEIINSWSQIFPSIIAVPRRSLVLQHDWIQLDQILGKGAFGEVFKARFTAPGATASIEVAAKRALGDAKRSQIQEFCHEASIQAVLQHENVVAFYGIASLEEPIIVLMELVTGGDLEKLLKSNLKLSKVQIIYFAMNIACGMRYIASKNVIHRDLAARNCLITKDLKAKISDFGLSRLGPQVIEKSIKKAPIRWMSPESLLTGVFNEKTDVWSYGVLLTEMMTRCAHKPLWPMGIKDAQEHIKTSDAPHRIPNGEPRELLAIVDACCANMTVEQMYSSLMSEVRYIFSKSVEEKWVPLGKTSVPQYLLSFETIVESAYWQSKRSRKVEDFLLYVKLARRYRKKLIKFQSNAELKYLEEKGSSRFSKYAKTILKPRSNSIPNIVNDMGKLLESDSEKANCIAESFERQYINEKSKLFELPDTYDSIQPTVWVTDDEVYKTIKRCKNSCSKTSDDVPFTFIKMIAPLISSALAQIFNFSMIKGEVPEAWKTSIVIPLAKTKNPSTALDFRPISLTSHLCRIYERCILNQLTPFLNYVEFWSPSQHGFLPKRSTVTNMLEAMNDWTEALDRGEQVDIIYIDFAKAFDRVPHDKLLEKLIDLKINKYLVIWLNAYLENRTFRVKVGETLSDYKTSICGVPQGAVLSPILFGVYVNSMSAILPAEVKIKQFADDTKIYTALKKDSHTSPLQDALNSLSSWCDDAKLDLNQSKTVTLTLGKRRNEINYQIRNQDIKRVTITRDLGFLISSNLDFSEHWKKAINAAKLITTRVFNQYSSKKPRLMILLYKTFIRPLVEYETRFNFQTVKRHMRTIYTNCLAAGNQQLETNQTPIGPTSGVIPLEMKKSNDRQKTMNTTLGRKKSRDGGMIKSSKSKKSKKSKRKFFSFRRKNREGIQLPTGMSTVPVGSPKATPTSQAPPLPTPPLQNPPLATPPTSVTSVPSPSQNSAPPISGPPTSTQSKSPTTPQ